MDKNYLYSNKALSKEPLTRELWNLGIQLNLDFKIALISGLPVS